MKYYKNKIKKKNKITKNKREKIKNNYNFTNLDHLDNIIIVFRRRGRRRGWCTKHTTK
jgi:hypothetical protein